MNIRIWDNHNQQWLEPMAIFFGKDNAIWKITACKTGEEPLSDGWYDIQGDDLKKIAITGEINLNIDLLPSMKNTKIKYYDLHVNDGVNSFSRFMRVKPGVLLDNPQKQDIIGHAIDVGVLDPDEMEYVDNTTEISAEEYNKATKA